MKKVFGLALAFVFALVSLAIAGEKVIYTVKRGDTLGELMYVWRVQGVEIEKLYSWNSNLGTQLKIGQKIIYYLSDRQGAEKMSEKEVKKIVADIMSYMEAEAAKTLAPAKKSLWRQVLEILLLCLSITIVVVALLALVFFQRERIKKMKKAKIKTQNPPIEPTPAPLKEIATIGCYIMSIATVGGKWYSPFKNGDGSRIYANTKAEIIRSTARCLKNEKFSEQLKKLLVSGEIKLKG